MEERVDHGGRQRRRVKVVTEPRNRGSYDGCRGGGCCCCYSGNGFSGVNQSEEEGQCEERKKS